MFCVNNILLAKPSVSYFCPANPQSLIGTAVLDNQIGPFSIFPALYFCNIQLCCLACCLYSKITATAEQTLTLFSISRNVFHLVAPPIDLAAVDYIKLLYGILVSLSSLLLAVELCQIASLHVDTGACLHNVRLTSTENVFCSTLVNTLTLLQHV